MPAVLILSSFVAANPVGGAMQSAVLARMGYETVLAPTVLFGRHPGLGPPGGAAVEPSVFASLLAGIGANGVFERVQAIITGYFAHPDQVAASATVIDAARAANPAVHIVVDPIMGDAGSGLYVSEAVAEALANKLVPLAGLIAPNAWELERLTGQDVSDPTAALAAARAMGCATLVSSVAAGGEIGVIYATSGEAWLATHERLAADPKGAGDLLAALFLGHRLAGATPQAALRAAVSEVAAVAADRHVPVRVTGL